MSTIGAYIVRFRHAPPSSPEERRQRRSVLAEDSRFWWRGDAAAPALPASVAAAPRKGPVPRSRPAVAGTAPPAVRHPAVASRQPPEPPARRDPVVERALSVIAASRHAFESGQLAGLTPAARDALIARSAERLASQASASAGLNTGAATAVSPVDAPRDGGDGSLASDSWIPGAPPPARGGLRQGTLTATLPGPASGADESLHIGVAADLSASFDHSIRSGTADAPDAAPSGARTTRSAWPALLGAPSPRNSTSALDAPAPAPPPPPVMAAAPVAPAPSSVGLTLSAPQYGLTAPVQEAASVHRPTQQHFSSLDLPSVPLELPDADNEVLIQRLRARFAAIDSEHQHVWRGLPLPQPVATSLRALSTRATPADPRNGSALHSQARSAEAEIPPLAVSSIPGTQIYADSRESQPGATLPSVPDDLPDDGGYAGPRSSTTFSVPGGIRVPEPDSQSRAAAAESTDRRSGAAAPAAQESPEQQRQQQSLPRPSPQRKRDSSAQSRPTATPPALPAVTSPPSSTARRSGAPRASTLAFASSPPHGDGASPGFQPQQTLSIGTSRALSPSFASTSSLLGLDLVAAERSALDGTAASGFPTRASALSFALSWDSASPSPPPPSARNEADDGARLRASPTALRYAAREDAGAVTGGARPGTGILAAAALKREVGASEGSTGLVGDGSVPGDAMAPSPQHGLPGHTDSGVSASLPAQSLAARAIEGSEARLQQPPSSSSVASAPTTVASAGAAAAPLGPTPALLPSASWANTPSAPALSGPDLAPGYVLAVPVSLLPGLLGRLLPGTSVGAAGAAPESSGHWEWHGSGAAPDVGQSEGGRTAATGNGASAAVSDRASESARGVPSLADELVAQWLSWGEPPATGLLQPPRRELSLPPPPQLVWRLDDPGC